MGENAGAVGGSEGAPAGPQMPAQNRPDVRGMTGAVSADHPLAAAVGYDVLRRGGNATDAVIAMAGVLAVVRPHMNGVGGDAFGIFYDGASHEVTALNGSGRVGALATPDFYRQAGDSSAISETGPRSVSVPGAVAAWHDAIERFGTWTLAEALRPAVGYAEDGFPVSWRGAADWEAQGVALNDEGRALYLPGGSAPPLGSALKNPALGATLRRISRGGKNGFYRGAVAEQLSSFLEAEGGHLRAEDFAAHTSTWVEPLQLDYLEHSMVVFPPNTQGMAQLELMGMAGAYDLEGMGHNTSEYLHTLIELKKLAFADRNQWAADPEFVDIPLERLLDAEYLRERSTQMSPTQAAENVAPGIVADASATDLSGRNDDGDTVYLTAVDRWGNGVSWIQSLFHGFGSGLLEPETGVLLHNRGSLFTLEEGHPNLVMPGKRPYHTLSPLMALNPDGTLAFTLGTPGGDSQPQTLIQIINNMLLFGMSPQEAIEAPRFRSYVGLGVDLEEWIPADIFSALASIGHEVNSVSGWTATFGGAQMIRVDPEFGTLFAASDPRREAYAIAY
jgi:gamma-glutamyltranspeptidase/glutathione hydrolase